MGEKTSDDMRTLLDGINRALVAYRTTCNGKYVMGDMEAMYWAGVGAVRVLVKAMVDGVFDEFAPSVETVLLLGYDNAVEEYCRGRVPMPGLSPKDGMYEVTVHVTEDYTISARFAREYEAVLWALHKSRVHRGLSYEVRVVTADD